MSGPRVLIAGIGNIFLGDDGFGSEVARRLTHRAWPEEVRVVDYGIRGLDLAYAIADGVETVLLVDAAPRGGSPGSVYVIEPDLGTLESEPSQPPDAHTMNPMNVLRMARAFAPIAGRVLVVGCEPGDLGDELEGRMGLSPAVEAAVEEAIAVIDRLLEEILGSYACGAAEGAEW